MSTNSPLFDRIRVKPDQDRRCKADLPGCQWPRCKAPATHRAPKGRLRASEYWQFCLEHVREYNNSYNFFAGMSDDAIAKYQKDAITGHRPTWKMGSLGGKRAAKRVRGAISRVRWARRRSVLAVRGSRRAPAPAMRALRRRAAKYSMRSAGRLTCLDLKPMPSAPISRQVQDVGETAPPRRQWWRSRFRGAAAGDHPSL